MMDEKTIGSQHMFKLVGCPCSDEIYIGSKTIFFSLSFLKVITIRQYVSRFILMLHLFLEKKQVVKNSSKHIKRLSYFHFAIMYSSYGVGYLYGARLILRKDMLVKF